MCEAGPNMSNDPFDLRNGSSPPVPAPSSCSRGQSQFIWNGNSLGLSTSILRQSRSRSTVSGSFASSSSSMQALLRQNPTRKNSCLRKETEMTSAVTPRRSSREGIFAGSGGLVSMVNSMTPALRGPIENSSRTWSQRSSLGEPMQMTRHSISSFSSRQHSKTTRIRMALRKGAGFCSNSTFFIDTTDIILAPSDMLLHLARSLALFRKARPSPPPLPAVPALPDSSVPQAPPQEEPPKPRRRGPMDIVLEEKHFYALKMFCQKGAMTSRELFKLGKKAGHNLYPSLTFLKRKVLDDLRRLNLVSLAGYSKDFKCYLGLKAESPKIAQRLTEEQLQQVNPSLLPIKQQINSKLKELKQAEQKASEQLELLKEIGGRSSKPKALRFRQLADLKKAKRQNKQQPETSKLIKTMERGELPLQKVTPRIAREQIKNRLKEMKRQRRLNKIRSRRAKTEARRERIHRKRGPVAKRA